MTNQRITGGYGRAFPSGSSTPLRVRFKTRGFRRDRPLRLSEVATCPYGKPFDERDALPDEGRGVTPERLPHLFRRYVETGEGEAAGFGLGLVICRGLVETHGGRIRVESAGAGLGARFTITLAAVAEAVARPPRTNGPAHELILDSRRSPSLDLKPTSLAPFVRGRKRCPRAGVD